MERLCLCVDMGAFDTEDEVLCPVANKSGTIPNHRVKPTHENKKF